MSMSLFWPRSISCHICQLELTESSLWREAGTWKAASVFGSSSISSRITIDDHSLNTCCITCTYLFLLCKRMMAAYALTPLYLTTGTSYCSVYINDCVLKPKLDTKKRSIVPVFYCAATLPRSAQHRGVYRRYARWSHQTIWAKAWACCKGLARGKNPVHHHLEASPWTAAWLPTCSVRQTVSRWWERFRASGHCR